MTLHARWLVIRDTVRIRDVAALSDTAESSVICRNVQMVYANKQPPASQTQNVRDDYVTGIIWN